eukprot:gene11620-481_t
MENTIRQLRVEMAVRWSVVGILVMLLLAMFIESAEARGSKKGKKGGKKGKKGTKKGKGEMARKKLRKEPKPVYNEINELISASAEHICLGLAKYNKRKGLKPVQRCELFLQEIEEFGAITGDQLINALNSTMKEVVDVALWPFHMNTMKTGLKKVWSERSAAMPNMATRDNKAAALLSLVAILGMAAERSDHTFFSP